MNITEIIRVTETHLTALRNQLIQASRIGDYAGMLELQAQIVTTELTLAELRQKPSAK